MATSQIIALTGSAQASNAIASTKAKVVASASFYYAVGANPVAGTGFANTSLAAGPGVTFINMEGVNNKISVLSAGTAGNVSITAVGTVANPPSSYISA